MSFKNNIWNFGYSNSSDNNLASNMNFGLSDYNANTPSLLGANVDLANGLSYNNDNSNLSGLSGFSLGSDNGTKTKSSFLNSLGENKGALAWGNTALGLLQAGLGFYLGKQQLDQAEDTLNENKRQFNLNYNAQKNLINDQLAWQHQARKDRNSSYNGTLTQIA